VETATAELDRRGMVKMDIVKSIWNLVGRLKWGKAKQLLRRRLQTICVATWKLGVHFEQKDSANGIRIGVVLHSSEGLPEAR
jgi:hypothetical protein